jgi:hypothetical protein
MRTDDRTYHCFGETSHNDATVRTMLIPPKCRYIDLSRFRVLPPTSTSQAQLPDSHSANYSQDPHIPRTPTYFIVHFVAHSAFIAGRHEMESAISEGQREQCFLTMFR